MNDQRWQMLVEHAKKNFRNVSLNTEDLTVKTAEGLVKSGTKDILEFTNQRGTFQVVRETKPVVLDKKMHYSHRQGDSARTEYTFSDKEFTHHVRFYKENLSGDFQELDSSDLAALLS